MDSETNQPAARITVRLLDPALAAALDRYTRQKRRKTPDVIRNAIVDHLEKEGYLPSPDSPFPTDTAE
jgi:predicted transcriptional regulator